MMDYESYSGVLERIKSPANKRDPRSLRLAAVASAIVDVLGQDSLSAAKVYASTNSALEGTLQHDQSYRAALESFSTQVALLELLRHTVPHVSPAIVTAACPATSRVLRAIVSSSLALDPTEMEKVMVETKDELGGISAVLRSTSKTCAAIMKCLLQDKEDKTIKQFFAGTLLRLFDDKRPKVRKEVHDSILEILASPNGCHPSIRMTMTNYIQSTLARALKNTQTAVYDSSLLHILGFLQRSVATLGTASLGTSMMQLLVALLQLDSRTTSSEFIVAFSKKDVTPKILTINALLAAVKVIVDGTRQGEQKKGLEDFTPRVLASLLQARPSLVFSAASADLELLQHGRSLYGEVILSALESVLETDAATGSKLLPVSVQMILLLSREIVDADASDTTLAEGLLNSMTALFRTHLQPLLLRSDISSSILNTSLQGTLQAMEKVQLTSYRQIWSSALKSLVAVLALCEDDESTQRIVLSFLTLRKEAVRDPAAQRAVEDALKTLIEAVGIEVFWNWVPWTNDSSSGITLNFAWLLPIIKSSTVSAKHRPNLAFFQKDILDIARKFAVESAKSPSYSLHSQRVTELWSLFSCFCKNPADLEEALPNLVPTLLRGIEDSRFPQLLSIVCGGLGFLCAGVKERLSLQEGSTASESLISVQSEIAVLEKVAVKLLPSLFKKVEELHKVEKSSEEKMDVDETSIGKDPRNETANSQSKMSVAEAIAGLASYAPQAFVRNLFKKLMHRLLEETREDSADKEKICSLLSLCQALVASEALDEASVGLLYRAVKPLVGNDEHEGRVQKSAYKVLIEICRKHHAFVADDERLAEFIDLLTNTTLTSQISARNMRLKCMNVVVEGFDTSSFMKTDIISKIAGESMLCLKDSNGKTRDASYQLLLSLANACGDLNPLLHVLAAGLGAETIHMKSAAVMALSRLVFEFARDDENLQSTLPSMLQTVLVLFEEKSREVIKSAVGFVRVCVAAMRKDLLEPLLPELVGGLLKYNKGKDRFRSKIKIILKKLVRMYGYDALMDFVPKSESRLLVHMRKVDERAARRKAAQRADGKADRGNNFDQMVDSDEEDSDDGRTLVSGFTKLTAKSRKTQRTLSGMSQKSKLGELSATQPSMRLSSEKDGEVVDMLDAKMTRKVHFAKDNPDDSDSEDDGVLEFDDRGRLIVADDSEEVFVKEKATTHEDEVESVREGKRQRTSKLDSARQGSRQNEQKTRGKRRARELGSAYKSKKAGGDVKKKGQKFEPYAYVPLDGRSYSKKHRREAVDQMATVVRQGKRKRK